MFFEMLEIIYCNFNDDMIVGICYMEVVVFGV